MQSLRKTACVVAAVVAVPEAVESLGSPITQSALPARLLRKTAVCKITRVSTPLSKTVVSISWERKQGQVIIFPKRLKVGVIQAYHNHSGT